MSSDEISVEVMRRDNPYMVSFSIISLLETAHDLSIFQDNTIDEEKVQDEITTLLQNVENPLVYKLLFFHFLRDIMHHRNRCLYVYDLWRKIEDPNLDLYFEVYMHLHNCIINDFYPLFEGLLVRGYNVNRKGLDRSLLHTAALYSLRYTHLLLQHGAVFSHDALDLTPAHYALHNVQGEGDEILNLFRTQGIDVESVRRTVTSPLK